MLALGRSFRNRDLRRLQLAWLGSVIGHWSYLVALSVYAYDQGGPQAVGLIWVIRLVPAAVLAPALATLADRYARERVMVVTNVVRAALMALMAAFVVIDAPAWTVYGAAIAATVVGVLFRPAQAALLPRLARDPAELTAANVASATIESVASFLGPALGGFLLAVWGADVVFAANAVALLWSVAFVLGIRARQREDGDTPAARRGFVREMSGGIGAIVTDRRVATVTGLYTAQTLVAGATNVLVVVVALELLDVGEAGVGYLNAALGVGGLVGGFLALVLAARRRLATDFGLGVVLYGLPLAAIGLVAGVPATIVAMALIGVGNALTDVSALTLLQRIVPDEVLGRVLGTLQGLLLAGIGVGALVAPVLIEGLGVETALVVTGGVLPVLTLLAWWQLRAIDRVAAAPAHTDLLRGVPFLTPLSEPVLEHLASTLTSVRVPAGELVIRQGEAGDRFYVVLEGEVEIEGKRFGPGESFGEIALLRDVPRTTNVAAVTEVVLQALERDEFLAAVTGDETARAEAHATAAARLGHLAGGATPM